MNNGKAITVCAIHQDEHCKKCPSITGLSNDKQQECNGTYEGCECHCRQPECGGHQNTFCEHCRPQQDTGLDKWSGENPYANGKQQDTGWYSCGCRFTLDERHNVKEEKMTCGYHTKQKQLSEQQGYQRGLQEIEKEVRRLGDTSDYPEWQGLAGVNVGLIPKEKVLSFIEELRKKLSEKLDE